MRERSPKRVGPECDGPPDPVGALRSSALATVPQVTRVLTRGLTEGCRLLAMIAVSATWAVAQSPWERAAINLELTFTGPLARSLALVSIVIGGLMFMFGEAGAKRQISGIVFGGGLALFATQFLAWLF